MATQASKLSPARSQSSLYEQFVNPQWIALPNILDMIVRYHRCAGSELFTEDGRRILDFLSGYCVHNTGHNHPYIVQALKNEMDKSGPAMLQSHVPEKLLSGVKPSAWLAVRQKSEAGFTKAVRK